MTDPLKINEARERQLFARAVDLLHGVPLPVVRGIAINLLINAIRQEMTERRYAEAAIDELFGRAKTLLLDKHYDSVTGKRKSNFALEIQMPFHVDRDKFFGEK